MKSERKYFLKFAAILACASFFSGFSTGAGAAVNPASSDSTLSVPTAGARPGEKDPMKTSILLRGDDMMLFEWNVLDPSISYHGMTPGKEAWEFTLKGFATSSSSFSLAASDLRDRVAFGTLRENQKNLPYIIAVLYDGQLNGITLKMYPAKDLTPSSGAYASQKIGQGAYYPFSVLTENWDDNPEPDVLTLVTDAYNDAVSVFGFFNFHMVDPNNPTSLGSRKDFNYDLEEIRPSDKIIDAAAGDLDGDGRKEIIITYLSYTGYKVAVYKMSEDMLSLCLVDQIDLHLYKVPSYNTKKLIGVSTGDVDGDGKDEIFWAGTASNGGSLFGLHYYLLYLDGGKLKQKPGGAGMIWGSITSPKNEDLFLVKSVLADFDANGKAEIAVATSSPYLQNKYPGQSGPVILFATEYTVGKPLAFSIDRSWEYGQKATGLDIVAGNFAAEAAPKAQNGNQIYLGLAYHCYGRIGYNEQNEPNRFAHVVEIYRDSNGEIRPDGHVGNKWEYHSADKLDIQTKNFDPVVLLADDFRDRSLNLGTPTHIVQESKVRPLVQMQEPPKHVDYTIQQGNKYDVVNLTRIVGYNTNFFQSNTNSEGVKTEQKSESGSAVAVDASVKVGHKAKLKGVGGHDVSAEVAGNISKRSTEIDENFSENYKSTTNKIKSATTGDDYIGYSSTTTDIWRYPIIGKYSLESPDHQIYYTVAIPSPEISRNYEGMKTPYFQPTWSNGNLLSYPRSWRDIEDFAEEKRIGGATQFTVGRNKQSQTVSWTEATKKSKTHTSSTSHHKDISFGIKGKSEYMGFYVEASVKTKFESDLKDTDTSTNVTSFNTESGFSVELPGEFPEALNNSNIYEITPLVYHSPSGAVKVAYAASIPKDSMYWWTQRYAGAPDPALNLPRQWVSRKISNIKTEWYIDRDSTTNPVAQEIRGFFISNVKNVESDPGIEETAPVNLYARIHNFAMKHEDENDDNAKAAVRNVKVKFEYQKKENGKPVGNRMMIAETTVPYIPVWNNNSGQPNWKYADAAWDVTKVQPGNYRIFVTVNSDKKIKELPYHSFGEYANNNEGWFDVAVLKPNGVKSAADLRAEGLISQYEGDDQEEFYEIGEVNLQPLDKKFTHSLNDEGMMNISTVLTNKGKDPAANVRVTLYQGNNDDAQAIAEQIIPAIFPGEEYPVTFYGVLKENYHGTLTLAIGTTIGEIEPESNSFTGTIGESSSGAGCNTGFMFLPAMLVPVLMLLKRKTK